jgi:23S rRNA (cytosine1962-C5)-methyltransferase
MSHRIPSRSARSHASDFEWSLLYLLGIATPRTFPAPTAAHAERAARAYKDINRLAFKLLVPGGALFTYSCSGGINADLFHKIVASAGTDAGVDGFISERLFAAPDHPMTVTFPEGEYLKGLVVIKK